MKTKRIIKKNLFTLTSILCFVLAMTTIQAQVDNHSLTLNISLETIDNEETSSLIDDNTSKITANTLIEEIQLASNLHINDAQDLYDDNQAGRFLLQTKTALHTTNKAFHFEFGDYNRDGKADLYAIKKNGVSGTTEVHILDGANNFQSFLLQTKTALHQTNNTFDFDLGDYNRDGKLDIYAIKKNGASGKTEIHVLNGANNFQSFSLQTATALHTTNNTFDFIVGDYNRDSKLDVYAIKKNGASGKTEIHVLNGANNFQSFSLQTATALHTTNSTFDFALGDFDKDGKPDLCAIKKSDTGTGSTEIHVMGSKDKYGKFFIQKGTTLHETNKSFEFMISDWNKDGQLDLVAIKKNGTSGTTEVHILSY